MKDGLVQRLSCQDAERCINIKDLALEIPPKWGGEWPNQPEIGQDTGIQMPTPRREFKVRSN